jgi:hypothetical protein
MFDTVISNTTSPKTATVFVPGGPYIEYPDRRGYWYRFVFGFMEMRLYRIRMEGSVLSSCVQVHDAWELPQEIQSRFRWIRGY